MRINLNVEYGERHKARALGARWDPARRTWYVENPEDLEPFRPWVPASLMAPKKAPRQDSKPAVATKRTDHSLPDCGCTLVPPWEDCEHTEPALDSDELAHIKSI